VACSVEVTKVALMIIPHTVLQHWLLTDTI